MNILLLIIQSLYFLLPAYLANISPILGNKLNILKFLAVPVDFGLSIKKHRIFGENKTFRGFFLAVIIGVIMALVQRYLYFNYEFFRNISVFNYSIDIRVIILLGILLGFGALFGDLIKSFFKRRFNKNDGDAWVPFDQLDLMIGALLFAFIIYIPDIEIILMLFIISPVLVIAANLIAYKLGIKKVWW